MNTAIKDLVKKTEVIVETSNIPELKRQWYRQPAINLNSTRLVLVKVSKYNTDYQVTYFDEIAKMERSAIVAPDFQVKLLNKKNNKDIVTNYDKYKMANLVYKLGFYDTIGSDPEVFLEKEDGTVLPAFDFLGPKPKKPGNLYAGNTSAGGNSIYWDGFQAEFDTYATSCLSFQVDSIQHALSLLYKEMIKKDHKAKLSIKTVMDIPQELLKTSAAEHVAFGCLKSFNVYNMKGIKADGREVDYRSAGGHIHFGTGIIDKKQLPWIVKSLDAVLGVAAVSLFANFDDPRRRQMYGLAGEYRLPPHGLEYRTLSNAWLMHPIMVHIIFDLARSAYSFGQTGFIKYWKGSSKETIRVINECDVDGARKILKQNEALFKEILSVKHLGNPGNVQFMYDTIINGAESVIANPENIAENWRITGKREWVPHSEGDTCNIINYMRNFKGEKI